MNATHHLRRVQELATALALAAGVTTGCGTGGSPEPDPEPDPGPGRQGQAPATGTASAYTGPDGEQFRAHLPSYTGQQVTFTGEVSDLVPSLVLVAPEDSDVPPLLVTARYALPEAEEGSVVEVTGTLRADVEARAGQGHVGDEAGFYDRHVGRPYLDEAELGTTDPAGT